MLTGGLEISRTLIVVWLLPVAGALILLIATRFSNPLVHGRVMVFVRVLLLAYVVGAVVLTLWPLDFAPSSEQIEDGNWTPFEGSLGFLVSGNELQEEIGGRDVLANVVMFVPIGLLLPFAFFQWRGIGVPLLIIGFLAFGLEFTQGFLVEERTFDIDDAIAGLVGGGLAAVVATIVGPLTRRAN